MEQKTESRMTYKTNSSSWYEPFWWLELLLLTNLIQGLCTTFKHQSFLVHAVWSGCTHKRICFQCFATLQRMVRRYGWFNLTSTTNRQLECWSWQISKRIWTRNRWFFDENKYFENSNWVNVTLFKDFSFSSLFLQAWCKSNPLCSYKTREAVPSAISNFLKQLKIFLSFSTTTDHESIRWYK